MENIREYLPDIDHHQFIFVVLLVITIYMIYNFCNRRDMLSSSLLMAAAGMMVAFGFKLWQRRNDTIKRNLAALEKRRRRVGGEEHMVVEDDLEYRSPHMTPSFRQTLRMDPPDSVSVGVKNGKLYGNRYEKTRETLVSDPAPPRLTDVDTDVVDDEGNMNADLRDDSYSYYGNISRDFDMDYIGQDARGKHTVALPGSKHGPKDGVIDNSDVVEEVLSNFSSTHNPLEAVSRFYHNVKDRQWYHKFFQNPENIVMVNGSAVPLNDRGINADDSLTRRQIHRGDMNKKATDGRVRATRNLFERFFTHELAENEARDWWDTGGQMIGGGFETDWRSNE